MYFQSWNRLIQAGNGLERRHVLDNNKLREFLFDKRDFGLGYLTMIPC